MKRYFFAVAAYLALIWLLSSEAHANETTSDVLNQSANGTESRSDKTQTFNSGGDTYNFYFQKAPGPNVVNQGGSPAAAQVGSGSPGPGRNDSSPVNEDDRRKTLQGEIAQKTVAAVPDKSQGRWTVGIGSIAYDSATFMGDSNYMAHGKGTALTARYSWNRYIGVEGGLGLIDISPTPNHATDYIWQDGNPGQWVPSDSLIGSPPQTREKVFMPTASLVLTPFRLNFFGHDLLEISFMAGVARDIVDLDNTRAFVGSTGGELALNVSSDFAMSINMTRIGNDDDKYGTSFNLLWRL